MHRHDNDTILPYLAMWGDKFGNDTHVFVAARGSSSKLKTQEPALAITLNMLLLRSTMRRTNVIVSVLLLMTLSEVFQGSGKLCKVYFVIYLE